MLQIQVDDRGNNQAMGGVILEEGSSVAIGGDSQYAGLWKGLPGKRYRVAFYAPVGTFVAIVELRGTVRWNGDGNLFEGVDNFLKIETSDASGVNQDIIARELAEDGLIVTTKEGDSFKLYGFSWDFSGFVKKL